MDKIGSGVSEEAILSLWREVLYDMYGEDATRKKEIYDIALVDKRVSKRAKEWLKALRDK